MASSSLVMAPDFKSRKREFHDFRIPRDLWPKIRAIHSEDDKEFVRFLGRELGKMCYDVLDDGKSNMGGRVCGLVVVVLSEKFLTTEACMAEFMLVMRYPRCLCVFYELSVEEFLNQSNWAKRREVWESWQGIQVSDVEAAWHQVMLEGRTLDCSTLADGNTIEFMKIIAQTISSRFIPLQVHWSQQTSCMQGRTRLCEEVDKCFFEGPLCDENVRVLGLHGMWSVGKTSLAKALCDFYSTEFQGRVYHAELLKQSSHLQLMKDLLRNLLGARQDFLEQNLTGVGQAYAYLDHCLKQSSEKVFLVVDNIQDSWECLERARDLFLRRVPFPKGSMVLFLARSSHTLEQLLLPLDKHCRIESIPSLRTREGYQIFVNVLFSDLNSESESARLWQQVINYRKDYVISLCVGSNDTVHPLRFKSLGCFFREMSAQYWLSAFGKGSAKAIFKDIKNLAKWKENNYLKTVFKALHEIYDSLDQQVQQVFIDIALYVPRRDLLWLCRLYDDKDAFFSFGFECLQKLRAVTLLTLEERKIEMPSLCRIFAEKVARDSEAHVYAVRERLRGADLSNMLNHGADVIERVCFEDCFFEDPGYILDLSNCKRLQVLRLLNVWCHPRLEVYLGRSKLLTLEISSIPNPVIVTGDLPCVRCFSSLDIMVLGNKFPPVENLEVLEINMSSADGFTLQEFSGECELEVLRLIHNRSRMLPPNLFLRLRELTLFDVDLYTLGGDILSNLHNLRTLHVQELDRLESLDTESMSRLQEVHVMKCSNLSKLYLPAGMWLKHCCIWSCDHLKKITVCDGSVDVEAPVDDDEVDEMRRYYPSPDKHDEKMTCSEHEDLNRRLTFRQQLQKLTTGSDPPEDLRRRLMRSVISFSSESKFSIVECRALWECDGLAKLTSITAFHFGSRRLTALDSDALDSVAVKSQTLRDGLVSYAVKSQILPANWASTSEFQGKDSTTRGKEPEISPEDLELHLQNQNQISVRKKQPFSHWFNV